MDPITIGTLAAAALSAGAGEAGKAVLGQAAKDAYASLKALVAGWAAPDVAELETRARDGASTKNREAVLAEAIDARPEPERAEARTLAEALSAALTAEGRGGALATVVNQFNAYDNSRQFNAPGGTQIFGSSAEKAGDET
jgi:hypothetical protein